MLDTPGVIATKKELKEAKTFKLVFAKDKGGTAGSRGHAREGGVLVIHELVHKNNTNMLD